MSDEEQDVRAALRLRLGDNESEIERKRPACRVVTAPA